MGLRSRAVERLGWPRVPQRLVFVRVAFITNLAPHYRRPLFETLAKRLDVDFFFFSAGQEPWISACMHHQSGDYSEVPLLRLRCGSQSITPGLVRHLRRERYDVVVKCMNGKLMVPFVYALTRYQNLPLVAWTGMWDHPATAFHRASRHLTRGIYVGAGAIVVYGDHVRDYIGGLRGVDSSKLFVASQAVDGSRFAPRSAPHKPGATVDVLYVGQLEERKGLEYLVDAFGRVPRDDARLLLVGAGSLSSYLAGCARRDPRIHLMGHRSQDEVAALLGDSRCLVLPSVATRYGREPWGLVVNEAMHSGIPVVASTTVGAAAGGLVVDGRNGFVVPERDSDALAMAIGRLVSDDELAYEMGRQALRDVQRFNYDAMADAFVSACSYAIARGASPG